MNSCVKANEAAFLSAVNTLHALLISQKGPPLATQSVSVADPGFLVGGRRAIGGGGTDLRRRHFLVKTCVKMKELDSVGGAGGAPWICQ